MSVLAIGSEPSTKPGSVGEAKALPPSMVERMTLILDAFVAPSTRLTLEQVARVTHLPRSTAHRILDQLVKLEWLTHSSFGYALGGRSLGLGGTGGSHLELREAAAGALHELQVRTGLVVHLAVLEDAEVRYLDKVGGRFATAVPSRVGGRAQAHCTALGKAMLAWLPAEEVEDRILPTLGRQTNRSISDIITLHKELTRIRARHGLAFERGECFSDISCVAAAIRSPEGPVAAISLVGDARMPLEKVAPLVAAAARQVTEELFPALRQPVRRASTTRRTHIDDGGRWSSAALEGMVAGAGRGWM
ncbi:MAG TPA: IclR family transcriptional regulator [Nocardioides sp.]|nr:IclR family transcriptional regulator [Nocardioides sp.]